MPQGDFMGFKLVRINDTGREIKALDDGDIISVELEGGRKWKGSVAAFIGLGKDEDATIFQSLGSPAERLSQVVQQSKGVCGGNHLFTSRKEAFIKVVGKASEKWAESMVPGKSKFTGALRGVVAKEDLGWEDLVENNSFVFNSPEDAAARVRGIINGFCREHPGWKPSDVIAFNKALIPGHVGDIESLYYDGQFADQTFSGMQLIVLPTDEAILHVDDLLGVRA
jgi:hypothetical protein